MRKFLCCLTACLMLVTATACQNNTVNTNTDVSTVSTPSDTDTSHVSVPSETENSEHEPQKDVQLDYSKIGTKAEGMNNLYKISYNFDKDYLVEPCALGNDILLQSFIYGDDLGIKAEKVIWSVYSVTQNKIVAEKTVEVSNDCLSYVVGDKIILSFGNSCILEVYDNNLNKLGTIQMPDDFNNMVIFSSDCKSLCYMSSVSNEIVIMDISDLSAKSFPTITVPINLKSATIQGVIFDNIVFVNGTDDNYLNVNRYISMKDGSEVEINEINTPYGIQTYDSSYFYYDRDYETIQIYFGERNGKTYKTFSEEQEYFWDYKNNALMTVTSDYDTNKRSYTYYSLKDGVQLSENIFSNNLSNIMYTDFYLPLYNAFVVFETNYENNHIEAYIWDLSKTTAFEDSKNLTIKSADEPDKEVDDWGALEPLHQKAQELGEKYGVEIYIGEECKSQPAWVYTGDVVTDFDTIENALNDLEQAFQDYPDGFIQQLKYGYLKKLKIYFMGTLTSNTDYNLSTCEAFTSTTNDCTYVVYDINAHIRLTTYHEFSHIIDRKLEYVSLLKENPLYSEDTWSSFNPEDFSYVSYVDYENGDLSRYDRYAYGDFGERYFISYYSMTGATEDRATLFESAIAKNYPWDNFSDITTETPIYKKMNYYAQCIRDVFDTEGWADTVLWEEILRDIENRDS